MFKTATTLILAFLSLTALSCGPERSSSGETTFEVGAADGRTSREVQRTPSRNDRHSSDTYRDLRHPQIKVRLAAAARLLEDQRKPHLRPTALAVAAEALQVDNAATRRDAAILLGQATNGEPEMLEALTRALRDEDQEVRIAAAAAVGTTTLQPGARKTFGLSSYGPRFAGTKPATGSLAGLVPELMKSLDDKSVRVRAAALDALLAIEPEPGDERRGTIVRVISDVYDVWTALALRDRPTRRIRTIQPLPFRIEEREIPIGAARRLDANVYTRALADAGVEWEGGEMSPEERRILHEALAELAAQLTSWASARELALAKRGIRVQQQRSPAVGPGATDVGDNG